MKTSLTVKQLNNYIKGVFEDELILHDITVEGEIFELRTSGNNTFIVLREGDSILHCYRYGRTESFEHGAKVKVRGTVQFYVKSGTVSLNISAIEYLSEGELYLEFSRLKQTLSEYGYFDNKKALPDFIGHISLITSVDGAVIHDFLEVLEAGGNIAELTLYNVSVQGRDSADEIVKAVRAVNEKGISDIIVIARGGGSLSDLQPYNTEAVAKAVYESHIPVISAVGHQSDYTLCDFCSDWRAGTPSIAAEKTVAINSGFLSRFTDAVITLSQLLERKVSKLERTLLNAANKVVRLSELNFAETKSRIIVDISSVCGIIENKYQSKINGAKSALDLLEEKTFKKAELLENGLRFAASGLDKLSPLKTLSKGYAKVLSDEGEIGSVKQVKTGQTIKVRMYDGSFYAKITGAGREEGNGTRK